MNAEGLNEEEVVGSIEASLVAELGLHPQDVQVTYDESTGVVTYTISSSNAESVAEIQETLTAESFGS